MLNKLCSFIRQHALLEAGDRLYCAVSGGADSMALLWAMYLLKEKLGIELCAAHFNHHLRGEESDRDEQFVRQFCADYQIPLQVGAAQVLPGKKGLEAAARDARYAFLESLPGKVATAHTANDNAETLLMHLVRGTGLKGLGGIAPVRGKLVRPMLSVTRQEVVLLLEEYSIPFVEDSSNGSDAFLRNRIRHQVMPFLQQENPSFAENLSATALRLRQDEQALDSAAKVTCQVSVLRSMEPAIRSRVLEKLLVGWGVKEPESEHIALAEQLVFSPKPSAKAAMPGGITVARNYDLLEKQAGEEIFAPIVLTCPGVTEIPQLNLKVLCQDSDAVLAQPEAFSVRSAGKLMVRPRQAGDTMRLPGGRKKLKELFIDRKIPAARRCRIPVVCDEVGILGVYGIGPNQDRADKPNLLIRFEPM